MRNEPVYVIILNWNNWKDTIECVESCLKLTYSNFRILIVDNGSTDNSESILRRRFPGMECIQTGSNLGFAGGNNVGICHALEKGADYVWLLNNDTIIDPDSLSELIRAAKRDERVGIVGSKIYYYDEPNKIWFAGGIWDKSRSFTTHRGMGEEDAGQFDEVCAVGFITGCSLLAKASMIREIGTMSEDYFLYWEDVDWNARAARHNWKILFVPGSRVWHKVSSSITDRSRLQSYYFMRGGLLFFQRHAPRQLVIFLLRVMSFAVSRYRAGQSAVVQGYLKGTGDFLLRRFGRVS